MISRSIDQHVFVRWIGPVAWSIGFAAFAAIGTMEIWPSLSFVPLRPGDAFISTDFYLEEDTGVPRVSARILEALAPLARDKAVVLVLPDNGVFSALINQNVSYLSWPREVRWLCADSPNWKEQLLTTPRNEIAAIILWETPSPNLPRSIRLGANQLLIPVTSAPSTEK
jgi:hypothetical protein